MVSEATVRFEGPDCHIRRVVLKPKQLVLFFNSFAPFGVCCACNLVLSKALFFFVVVEVDVVATWWNCEARRGEAR